MGRPESCAHISVLHQQEHPHTGAAMSVFCYAMDAAERSVIHCLTQILALGVSFHFKQEGLWLMWARHGHCCDTCLGEQMMLKSSERQELSSCQQVLSVTNYSQQLSCLHICLIVLAKAILALHIALLNVLLKSLGANLQLPAFQFSLAEAAPFLLSQ